MLIVRRWCTSLKRKWTIKRIFQTSDIQDQIKDARGLESHESQTFPPQKTLDSARVLTENVIISVGIGRNSSLFQQESFKS